MAITKVIGTETEYGIAAVGQPDFNPVLSSSLLRLLIGGLLVMALALMLVFRSRLRLRCRGRQVT